MSKDGRNCWENAWRRKSASRAESVETGVVIKSVWIDRQNKIQVHSIDEIPVFILPFLLNLCLNEIFCCLSRHCWTVRCCLAKYFYDPNEKTSVMKLMFLQIVILLDATMNDSMTMTNEIYATWEDFEWFVEYDRSVDQKILQDTPFQWISFVHRNSSQCHWNRWLNFE